MSKDSPIELFTLKALASEENISYSHMKKLMMEIVKTLEWRGWRFLPIGAEPTTPGTKPRPKIVWLAYRGKQNIVIHNEPKEKEQEKPDAETPTVDASDAEAPAPAPQQEG